MGLFDGAPDGSGSTADAALATGWPVVLVVDVRGQAASAAAVIHGFKTFRPEVPVAAVLFNRVGGEGHVRTLKQASAGLGLPILGFVPRSEDCVLPSRHLGLVGRHVDIAALKALARPGAVAAKTAASSLPPLGQRIAVARDAAFAFSYPHLLDGWRTAGAEIHPFSPLADESPAADADAIYLPGGYPELHAGRLASNDRFLGGLRRLAARGVTVYGECGGYMVLGRVLIDAEGLPHPMAGLLPVDTSFAERRLHLGYRAMRTLGATPLGPAGAAFRGHEFHFARLLKEDGAPPLFQCRDAVGTELGTAGAISGSVAGSFLHVIDTADDKPL
jgi:cobyrinic acid a,c-diamide synthase